MNSIGIFLGYFHQYLLIDHSGHNVVLWIPISTDQSLEGLGFLFEPFGLPPHFLIDSLGLLDLLIEFSLGLPLNSVHLGVCLNLQGVSDTLGLFLPDFGLDGGPGHFLGPVLLGLLERPLDLDVLLELHLYHFGVVGCLECGLFDDELLFGLDLLEVGLGDLDLLPVPILHLHSQRLDIGDPLSGLGLAFGLPDVADFVLFGDFDLGGVLGLGLDTLGQEGKVSAALGVR